jgi:tRNA 2-thiouridine synthesizing protein A
VTEVLDLRGLPPPEPLVRTLEAVEALPEGDELVVLTERRPVHLLSLLLERGVEVTTERELADGHEIHVRR